MAGDELCIMHSWVVSERHMYRQPEACDSAVGLAPLEQPAHLEVVSSAVWPQTSPRLLESSPRSPGRRCPSKLRMTLFCLKPFLTNWGWLFLHGIRDALISHVLDAARLRRSSGCFRNGNRGGNFWESLERQLMEKPKDLQKRRQG